MTADARPVVVLVPGMGNNARLWSAQVADLSDAFDVIVADYSGAQSVDEMADKVVAQLPADSFSLAGFSLGSYIALMLLGRDAVRADRLALISVSPFADSDPVAKQRAALIDQAAQNYDSLLEEMARFIVCPKGPLARETREAVVLMGRELGAEEFCRQQRAAMQRPDIRHLLSAVRQPVQVLCGAQDRVTPVSGNRYVADRIPGASFEVIEDSGHPLPLERPQQVCSFLRSWLQPAVR